MSSKRRKRRAQKAVAQKGADKNSSNNSLLRFFEVHYKPLLIIPLVLFILALAQIGFQIATTGDFVDKGISLKGGLTIAVTENLDGDLSTYEDALASQFPGTEIIVRELVTNAQRSGIVVTADVADAETRSTFEEAVLALYETRPDENAVSVEATGPSLGASFYRQTFIALIVAFLFMGFMVFMTFRKFVPSALVITAAICNLIMTLAVFNLFNLQLSTAGVAAFLMLLGYSVDTDILLTSRVMRTADGTIFSRVVSAWKTGTMMSVTTFVALVIGYFFASSAVIHEIMTIVLIGLALDYINTWVQNAGLLRWSLQNTEEGR